MAPAICIESAKKLCSFDVLLMDSTYNTNRCVNRLRFFFFAFFILIISLMISSFHHIGRTKMALFHVMGVSSTHQSLSLCFCFMQQEHKDHYVWALEEMKKCFDLSSSEPRTAVTDRELALTGALEIVFPQCQALLCIWHIDKNVLANIKKDFNAEEWDAFHTLWQKLVNSLTPESFEENLAHLQTKIHRRAFDYISSTWLVHKEKFILAWTKDVKHFGHTVTSRVEAGHANIKKWLSNANGDLATAYEKIVISCTVQHRQVSQKVEYDKSHTLTRLRPGFWGDVNRKISQFALSEVSLANSVMLRHRHQIDGFFFRFSKSTRRYSLYRDCLRAPVSCSAQEACPVSIL